jgi:ubiquinol-cytochrome c reductase cytochrome b subunit
MPVQMSRLAGVLRRDPDDPIASALTRITVYSFVVAGVSGILLLPWFSSSPATVTYHGSYRLLDGMPMSAAYQSVLNISLNVRGGLLIRQVHHWSALVFTAAICLRLVRAFFRGSFRRWLIWVTLIPVAMVTGLSGTILPDDMLSGGSLSVFSGVTLSVPLVGTQLNQIIFGSGSVITKAYWVHIIVLPAVLAVLLVLACRPEQTRNVHLGRRRAPGLVPDVGRGRLPGLGRLVRDPLLWSTCGVLVLLGGLAQVNPVWLYGPFVPGGITSGAVPDWYMGFLDGALRIMPGWELDMFGHTLTLAVLIPGVIVPGMFFTALAGYPMLERRFPRLTSERAGIAVAGITFYGLLWAAASNDEIAYHLHYSLYAVTWAFRVAVLAGPPIAFGITRSVTRFLAAQRRDEQENGMETGVIVANAEGGYSEVRRKLTSVK